VINSLCRLIELARMKLLKVLTLTLFLTISMQSAARHEAGVNVKIKLISIWKLIWQSFALYLGLCKIAGAFYGEKNRRSSDGHLEGYGSNK
jgi:hypothetical protein